MEEIISYYVNLLILQYRNKPKARGTIEALAKSLFEDINKNVFLLEFQNAYDLDTSLLAQLKTLAKYIGYSDKLNIIEENFLKLSDYEGTDETPGLSSYDETFTGLHLLSYSGYTYIEKSVTSVAGISFFRKVLKFLSEMKNEILSVESLDRVLHKHFNKDLFVEDIFVEEGNKEITYFYSDDILEKFGSDTDLVESFIKKFMPRPMGCEIQVQHSPYYLNLISVGGAIESVDENFIYKRDSEDTSKYFETPNDINITDNDKFEIGIRVKINSSYQSSGFFKTKDIDERFTLFKRRITNSVTLIGFSYIFEVFNYSGYTDGWLDITLTKDPSNIMQPGFFVNASFEGQPFLENVYLATGFVYSGKMLFCIGGYNDGFVGEMDFKKCYMKKNDEYIWMGLTNKKGVL